MLRIGIVIALVSLVQGCAASRPDLLLNEESIFLGKARQLITIGHRSGEGYFSADGSLFTFQAEAERDNPFYQIYLLQRATGEITRISPGFGKTTCSWVHPSNDRVLFASTHSDPSSIQRQADELKARASNTSRPYQWDYDEQYDIYETMIDGGRTRNLTAVLGYDAEGSYSPDGKWIVFASNRKAYSSRLSPSEVALRDRDPSYFMELYLMRSDGTQVRQLTDTPGYDGGPFFSPRGDRITWRRFSADGRTAEIFTMAVNGSDERQITHLGALSWAPFYHPSGAYLAFATSVHGHRNFELYIVDVEGCREPVRVTFRDGFDGLPVFSPSGDEIAWASSRTEKGKTHIFIAEWNHTRALTALAASSRRSQAACQE
ncbi:MAG: biopolymer transporter Tol [Bdellovibrionota bacterium]|nr:MAG: biopolymer transporter Tol [Bdellovibrionota bacterium]